MRKLSERRIIAFVLVLAMILSTVVTVDKEVKAASSDKVTRIFISSYNDDVVLREGQKITSDLIEELHIVLEGQTASGGIVNLPVKVKEKGNYIHSVKGKTVLTLYSGNVTKKLKLSVKVKAKKLKVKVKKSASFREGQVLTQENVENAVKATCTYADKKKVSSFKGFRCKQIGEVVKPNKKGKFKITLYLEKAKKTVYVKVNRLKRIYVAKSSYKVYSGEKISEENFRKHTNVMGVYKKGANKKLSTYTVTVKGYSVTVKYGKKKDSITFNPITKKPTLPTLAPSTEVPTATPTATPTEEPTSTPTVTPIVSPTEEPTPTPTVTPIVSPTEKPTPTPTVTPIVSPTEKPTPMVTPTATPVPEYTVTVNSSISTIKLNGRTMGFSEGVASETNIAPGTKITLTATDTSSSRFVRWTNKITGKELSTSKTYSFAVDSNTEIVAVFETVYTLTVKRVGGKGKVTLAEESLDFYNNVAETTVVPETYELEAKSTDDYIFVSWTDEKGKVLSTNLKLSVSVTSNKTVYANFAEAEKTVTVTYTNEDNELLLSEAVKFGETLAPTNNVVRSEKIFSGWKIGEKLYEGTSSDTEFYSADRESLSDAIKALTAAKQNVTVVAYYVDEPPTYYTLSVTGGTMTTTTGGSVTPNGIESGTHVYVKADVPDGYLFANWQDADGNVLSYNEEYDFFINQNTTIKATFSKDEVEKEPLVYFNGEGVTLNYEQSMMSFSMSCEIPTGYKKLEWGLLMSTKLTAEEMLVDASLTKKVDTSEEGKNALNAQWTYDYTNATLFNNHKKILARAYAIIQNSEGTKTIYSNVITIQL